LTISLLEAESLRAVLHHRQGLPLSHGGSTCTVALHLLQRTGEETVELEASTGHTPSKDREALTVHQALRFIDSELDYTTSELTLLLRGLQDNEPAARQHFFGGMRSARRRAQIGMQAVTRPIARLFSVTHEYHILHHFSVMSRIRLLLQQRGLYTLDAFRAFNAAQNGLMSCSELYGGLVWLGMQVGPPDIWEMVRHIDTDGDGFVSFDEFRLAVGSEGDTEMWAHELEELPHSLSLGDLKPIAMKELYETLEGDQERPRDEVPSHMLSAIKLKLQKLEKFDEVWHSKGIASKSKVSVWEGRLSTKRLAGGARNRTRVCLGHFATNSWSTPRGEKLVLEITDMSVNGFTPSKWLDAVVWQSLPHPARFHRVWGLQTGSDPIFFWHPVPPTSEFVALGMIVSSTEEPPSIKSVHCVPRNWVEPAPTEVKMLWSDSGASGKPGSIWSIGGLQLLGAAQGQTPPGDASWKLKRARFTLGDGDMRAPRRALPSPDEGAPQLTPRSGFDTVELDLDDSRKVARPRGSLPKMSTPRFSGASHASVGSPPLCSSSIPVPPATASHPPPPASTKPHSERVKVLRGAWSVAE